MTSPPPLTTAHWHHHFIETNTGPRRIRLHYVSQGEGDLVILLHGFFEFWYSWRHQIPVLARRYKVVVPDLRGCNDSDKPEGGYDLTTLTADLAGLIRGLGYQKAHIVGHGWGGTLAWAFAQQYPTLVRRSVILSGVHPHHWRRVWMQNLEALRQSWPLLISQVPPLPDWILQSIVPDLVTRLLQSQPVRKTAFSLQDTQIYRAALEKPGAIAAALQQYRQVFSWQSWFSQPLGAIAPITIPTLVLWGQEDTLLSPQLNQGIDQYMAAPLTIRHIPQCGHWIQQEVPHWVNRALLDFLPG